MESNSTLFRNSLKVLKMIKKMQTCYSYEPGNKKIHNEVKIGTTEILDI